MVGASALTLHITTGSPEPFLHAQYPVHQLWILEAADLVFYSQEAWEVGGRGEAQGKGTERHKPGSDGFPDGQNTIAITLGWSGCRQEPFCRAIKRWVAQMGWKSRGTQHGHGGGTGAGPTVGRGVGHP